ncbi:MAG: lipopolysaccharide heptosyltransferase II [Mariprofundaceae bacterium]|nr:lipopolysaccharide heptosyltransferase II [Mariprofundaceae bacterium]
MTTDKAEHLVILPPNWLGDVIMAQPAMRAFCTCHKGARTTLVGQSWLSDLAPFLGLGNVSCAEQVPADADMAVLFPNSFSSAWKVFRSGIPVRTGFRGQWRSLLLSPGYTPGLDMSREHHRDYFLDLAEQAGAPVKQRQVELSASASDTAQGQGLMQSHGLDPDKTICIAPGAQFGGAKRYPAESYRHIIKSLSEAGWQILILGTAAERRIAEACLAEVAAPGWNSSGETSLKQALQILAACRLLLCNDSGLMHVAAGMGRPVVGIFGATDPQRTAPSGPHVRLLYRPAPCSPCLQRECSVPGQPCMANIRPETVRDACLEMLT